MRRVEVDVKVIDSDVEPDGALVARDPQDLVTTPAGDRASELLSAAHATPAGTMGRAMGPPR